MNDKKISEFVGTYFLADGILGILKLMFAAVFFLAAVVCFWYVILVVAAIWVVVWLVGKCLPHRVSKIDLERIARENAYAAKEAEEADIMAQLEAEDKAARDKKYAIYRLASVLRKVVNKRRWRED
ncbi:MAG: hypothetical protein ACYDHF_05925 [Candidatus Cryosericum sp.]